MSRRKRRQSVTGDGIERFVKIINHLNEYGLSALTAEDRNFLESYSAPVDRVMLKELLAKGDKITAEESQKLVGLMQNMAFNDKESLINKAAELE